MNILERLSKSRNVYFLLFTSLIFFILRLPSLFEPYWYGDEGIYQVLGLGIRHGRLLYQDIFDNKPPLLYVLYSIFNSDQFLVRTASLIFGLAAVFIFFKLTQKILKEQKSRYIATFIFALLFGLPLIEGNIANAENFMLLFNISAALLIFNVLGENSTKRFKILFVAGFILGISFLFKIVAVFDFAAFSVFLFILNKDYKSFIKNNYSFLLGFAIPIAATFLYFFANGAFSEFMKATFSNNIGYVGYGNKFIIPQGLLILKFGILAAGTFILFIKRKSFEAGSIFVYLWLFFSLFDALFAQRPYTHYVLVTVPAVCLLIGLVLAKRNFIPNILLLGVSLYLLLSVFSYYIKTIYYYPNFVSFVTGKKSVYDYQNFFDRNTPNDYNLASFINDNSKKDDNIFIWGNNAQLYKLTEKLPPGKYSVAYHITSYKDGIKNTMEGLQKQNPKFIIIMRNASLYPFSLTGYFHRININGVNIYERIY